MRTLLAISALVCLAAADREDALKALAEASNEVEAIAGIRAAAAYPDGEVVALVAKHARSGRLAERTAAIEALGFMRHADAFTALRDACAGFRLQNEDLVALALRSLTRHNDPAALPMLATYAFPNPRMRSGTAAILGLGNVRAKGSVELLIKLWRRSSSRSRRGFDERTRPHFATCFRVAATMLTGQDLGANPDTWEHWWTASGADFEVARERPALPPELAAFWEKHWGATYALPVKELPPTLERPFPLIDDPDQPTIAWAVQGLKEAFDAGADAEIMAAIENNRGILHEKVTYQIARGLRASSPNVRLCAIHALGWTPDPAALQQLHRTLRRESDLRKSEAIYAALLTAIGRHESPSSLAVFAGAPFTGLTVATGRARIHALGRIRSAASVHALMRGMRARGAALHMEAFRLALLVLTAHDAGDSRDEWQAWWKENGKSFVVAKERALISRPLQAQWETFWKEPY